MRNGTELKAYDRSVPFSFWPTAPGVPRPSVQSLLFAIDPWVIMRHAISRQVNAQQSRMEALSYIEQARDFYEFALTLQNIGAAKPVQLYYSYLNIAKAFIISRGIQPSLARIQHGINEAIPAGGREFHDAYLQFWRSPNQRGDLQAFDEFMQALGCVRPSNGQHYPMIYTPSRKFFQVTDFGQPLLLRRNDLLLCRESSSSRIEGHVAFGFACIYLLMMSGGLDTHKTTY